MRGDKMPDSIAKVKQAFAFLQRSTCIWWPRQCSPKFLNIPILKNGAYVAQAFPVTDPGGNERYSSHHQPSLNSNVGLHAEKNAISRHTFVC